MIHRRTLLSSTLTASLPVLFMLTAASTALSADVCTTDDDCGEYLSCQVSAVPCWDGGEEGLDCAAPDADSPKHCSIPVWSCSGDDDCPREFECVTSSREVCPDIACDDREGCAPCEPYDSSVCLPRQIECEGDGDCPEDWACTGGAGGDVPTAPEPDTEGRPLPPPSAPQCVPSNWLSDVTDPSLTPGTSQGDAAAEDASRTGSNSNSSSGGCSVSAGHVGGAAQLLLALPLLAVFRRRRTLRT